MAGLTRENCLACTPVGHVWSMIRGPSIAPAERLAPACGSERGFTFGLHRLLDRRSRLILVVGPEVGIGVEGLGSRGVTEPFLYHLHRVPGGDEHAGVVMAELVEDHPIAVDV